MATTIENETQRKSTNLYAIERSRKELLKTLQRCERRTEVDVTDVIAATAEQAVGTQKKLPAQQRAER